MFKTTYRVVTYRGPYTGNIYFMVQVRYWWFPFWVTVSNFLDTKEEAIAECVRLKNPAVWSD